MDPNLEPAAAKIVNLIVGAICIGAIIADLIIIARWLIYISSGKKAEYSKFQSGEDGAMQFVGPFASEWSLVIPFFSFQASVLVANLIGLIFLLFFMLISGSKDISAFSITDPKIIVMALITVCSQNLLCAISSAYFLRSYGTSLHGIGLGMPKLRQIGLGLLLGAGLFIIATICDQGITMLLKSTLHGYYIHLERANDAMTAGGLFDKLTSLPLKIMFAAAGIIVAPIGEEIFFRGLLYNSLKRQWGVPAAIVVSGVIFAVAHFGPIAILGIIPMGMLLAYVYERTKSLWVTITMHMLNNLLAFGVEAYFQQHPRT